MKGSFVVRKIIALVLFGLIAPHAHAESRPGRAGAEAAVREIVRAYNDNAYEAYFAIFADDITIFAGARGRWTKQHYHDIWKKAVDGGGGVASAGIADLQIQMSPKGDAALTTFMMPVKNRFPGGIVPPGRRESIVYNMTEVWYYRAGKWDLVHMYWTVQDPPPA